MLVFLPGLAEISQLLAMCTADKRLGDRRRFRVLPLHSSLSPSEQSAVFETMPPGVRKVVLATNIAETSITIDDAVFVIDSGRAKQSMFDERLELALRVVTVLLEPARVDDVRHVVDGDRRLGDVGRDHDLGDTRRRPLEGAHLLRARERRM